MFEKMLSKPTKLEQARVQIEKEVDPEFLRQFRQRETLPFLKTEGIRVADITPTDAHEVPVLFVPGWGSGPDAYLEALAELYKSKRRVIVFSFPTDMREQDFPNRDTRIPFGQDMKSEVLRTVLQAKHINCVDIVAHSEGCMNAIVAADKEDASFRNFVLVAPPGITGVESYRQIIVRGSKNKKSSKLLSQHGSTLEQARVEMKKNDITQWLRGRGLLKGLLESTEPGRFETLDMQRALHQRGHGISVVLGVDDAMISMNQVQSDSAGNARSVKELGIDGLYSVAGGHEKLSADPNRYGFLVADALENLESKYKNTSGQL